MSLKRTLSKSSLRSENGYQCKRIVKETFIQPEHYGQENITSSPIHVDRRISAGNSRNEGIPHDPSNYHPSRKLPFGYEIDEVGVSRTPPVFYYSSAATSRASSRCASFESSTGSSWIDGEMLPPSTFYEVLLDYIDEVSRYWQNCKEITFGHLAKMLHSVPTAWKNIQNVVRDRLGLPWHLVGNIAKETLNFICDADIREATIGDIANFLTHVRNSVHSYVAPTENVVSNICQFFQKVLENFKTFLKDLWIRTRKIRFPCEFGQKSNSLFLCMECHREHC